SRLPQKPLTFSRAGFGWQKFSIYQFQMANEIPSSYLLPVCQFSLMIVLFSFMRKSEANKMIILGSVKKEVGKAMINPVTIMKAINKKCGGNWLLKSKTLNKNVKTIAKKAKPIRNP